MQKPKFMNPSPNLQMGVYLPNSYPSLAFVPFISFGYSVL